ncbi:hypothetical protein M2386_000081 [Erwinia rhapontici]|nr:hypothetical protein [Erwinia rhapontici]MCS3605141.1 hypothetical protein [Erwinia rhapontici]
MVLLCREGLKETLRRPQKIGQEQKRKKPENHKINGLHNKGISKKSSGIN